MESTGTAFIHLECSKCGTEYSRNKIYNLSPCCSLPLFPIYDLDKAHSSFNKNDLLHRQANMWRYKEMMPVNYEENITTLGEGFTPLEPADSLGKILGFKNLFLKNKKSI